MSTIVPNTFQTPNEHVDRAMQYLTGDEYKVLNFATRHILGWQKRIDERCGAISLSVFQNGFKNTGGCGLSKPAIIKILDTLDGFGLLVKVGEPDQKGQRYSIGETPDWQKMETRQEERNQSNRTRTSKARSAIGGQSDSTSTVPLTTGGQSDNTTGGQSDSTHIKPDKKPKAKPEIPASSKRKANLWYDAVFEALEISASRNGGMQKMLQGIATDKTHKHYNLTEPITPDELIDWRDWYRECNGYPAADFKMVKSPEKVQSSITTWQELGKPKAKKSTRIVIEPVPEPAAPYEQYTPSETDEAIDFDALINDITEAKRVR